MSGAGSANRWLFPIGLCLATACGGHHGKTYIQKKQADEPSLAPSRVAGTAGSAERRSPDAKRQLLWTIRWKTIDIDLANQSKVNGTMYDVAGTIYRGGKEAGTYIADEGFADRGTGILRLKGKVTLTSIAYKSRVHADAVEYRPSEKIVDAVGNVQMESPSGTVGTFPEVLATPDLKHVATADLHPNPMRRSPILAAALAASASMAAAPNVYRSADGNLTLKFGSMSADIVVSGQRYRLGRGVDAQSDRQGLRMTSSSAVIVTTKVGEKTDIKTIDAVGNVVTTKTVSTAKGSRVTEIHSDEAHAVQGSNATEVRLVGKVKVIETNSVLKRVLSATGSGGHAALEPGKQSKGSGLRSATLGGPVRVEVTQAAVGKQASGVLVVTGSRLEITGQGSNTKLKLRGPVHTNGTQGSQAGAADFDRLFLFLNANGEVTSYSTEESGP